MELIIVPDDGSREWMAVALRAMATAMNKMADQTFPNT